MADLGVAYTDDALKDIEKQLKSVYGAAYKDMLQKQKDFNAAYAKKEAKYQAQLSAGQITQDQFDAWKKGQDFQGEQWQAKKKQILDTLYSSNEIAAKIVNGQAVDVFAFNANYQSFNLEHGAGINFGFGLYDSASVTNLIKNDPKLLPEWKIDQPKDYTWNQKKLNRQINLGIIEGESLDKIANRLCDSLSTQNFNHMRTFARTAMTGAQNAGREISLQEAQDKGINVKKEWMCTLDGHTRTNHRLLDGQRRPLDKPFEAGGMKIRYPGDPTAHPSMVYNCRCTMVGDLEDYPATYDRYDNIDGKPIKNMTYDEWVKAKSAGTDINPIPLSFSHANIPTISASTGDVDDLINLFKDKKMSNVYNDMKALDTKSANQFYKELKGMGKPSDIWQQYLDGTLPAAQADKITQMLEDYANKAGLLKKEANIAEQFLGKKMSNVYTDMKATDTKLANQFYKELKGMGKPSDVWQQYLDGTLDDDQKEAIEKYLKKYLEGDGKLLGSVSSGAAKVAAKTAEKELKDLFSDDIFDLPDDVQKKVFDIAYDSGEYPTNWTKLWEDYLDGKLDNNLKGELEDYLTKYAKDHGMIKDTVTKAAVKATKAVDNLDDAEKALKKIQDEVDKLPGIDKTFKGIWKDDVTYADYEAKKASIAAKKKYYEDQIDLAKANGWTGKVNKFENLLDDLEEFEKNGEAYSKKLKELQDAKKIVQKFTPNTGTFDPSVYEETAKKAAKKFSNKSAADQFHRTYLDSIWDDLDNEEKYGIWEYTRNSNPMNKSLSGYHDSWNRSSFLGPDKTDWGHEDPWRSIPSAFKKYGEGGHVSYHKAITNTTKAIEKSQLPESCYLVRGSDNNGFAGMIEGGPLSFDAAKKLLDSGDVSSIAKALEGQVIQNHAFTSTGIASGTGFGGQVAYRIYAPKGTKAIYAEPQSYFGNTVGSSAKLYKKGQSYGSVGGEAEVILQRGTKFRVTGVKKEHGALVVDMEVVEQPDYFKFGDEDTFNGGKTRHKK